MKKTSIRRKLIHACFSTFLAFLEEKKEVRFSSSRVSKIWLAILYSGNDAPTL